MTRDEWEKVSAVRALLKEAEEAQADGDSKHVRRQMQSALWLLDELAELHGAGWSGIEESGGPTTPLSHISGGVRYPGGTPAITIVPPKPEGQP